MLYVLLHFFETLDKSKPKSWTIAKGGGEACTTGESCKFGWSVWILGPVRYFWTKLSVVVLIGVYFWLIYRSTSLSVSQS